MEVSRAAIIWTKRGGGCWQCTESDQTHQVTIYNGLDEGLSKLFLLFSILFDVNFLNFFGIDNMTLFFGAHDSDYEPFRKKKKVDLILQVTVLFLIPPPSAVSSQPILNPYA